MQIYRATNIETGEIIEGGARDIARKLGVVQKTIYNAVAMQQNVRFVWFISTDKKQKVSGGKPNKITPDLLDKWDKETEPFKRLSARKRAKGV